MPDTLRQAMFAAWEALERARRDNAPDQDTLEAQWRELLFRVMRGDDHRTTTQYTGRSAPTTGRQTMTATAPQVHTIYYTYRFTDGPFAGIVMHSKMSSPDMEWLGRTYRKGTPHKGNGKMGNHSYTILDSSFQNYVR